MITKTEINMKSSANCSVNLYWPNGSPTSHKRNALWTKGKTLSHSGAGIGITMRNSYTAKVKSNLVFYFGRL